MKNTLAPRLAQLSDAQRERAIELSHGQLVHSRDNRTKLASWRVLSELIKGRNPEFIALLKPKRGVITQRTPVEDSYE